jgi:hypothetical protein
MVDCYEIMFYFFCSLHFSDPVVLFVKSVLLSACIFFYYHYKIAFLLFRF